jgi:hypothetical protein
VIYAESEALYSLEAFAYRVDAGGALQQIAVVDATIWRDPSGFLPFATAQFTPQTGGPQNCRTGLGPPYTPCRFWSDLSPAIVRASASGYTDAEQSFMPTGQELTRPLSLPRGIILKLKPIL